MPFTGGNAKRYDLAVIGSGSAAMVAAMRVRGAGRTVAVIDHRPFGGTCALRGCDPKKMLVGGAAALDHARRMHGRGIAGDARIDWRELIAFKRAFTDPVPARHEASYAAKGIDTYHGRARFTSRSTLAVDGETIEARAILVAAGAEPVALGIAGEEHLATSERFLELDALPQRIVLVGGGYIAAEFSHLAARAGANVTILQRAPRLLARFDADCVGWLMESFRRWAIDVRTRTTVEAIEKRGRAFLVRARAEPGALEIEADLVVHAAGRMPALEALDLQAGGVETENGRLRLNEYLQSTSNASVYAAGDAAGLGPPLTPVSSHDAKVAAENIVHGNRARPDYRAVPSVAFSIPPIAAVGLDEAAARGQGLRFRVNSRKASDWFTARQAAEPVYGFKILVEEQTERILGAHLVGAHADEVINLFALAIRQGLNAGDLRTTMFAYPTGASDIGYMLG
jgi:glutathione reductase (NADPH)